MLRFVVLLAVIAPVADIGANPRRPHTIPRNKLDMQHLPVPLPVRGIALQTFQMGSYVELEVLDTDARTLRIIADNWDPANGHQRVDKTLPLDRAQLEKLTSLSKRAWREHQNGEMRDVTDVRQDLFIVDHDDAFYLSNSLIATTQPHETSARRNASALVIAIEELARPILSAPLPPAPATHHKHSITRDALGSDLPRHGMVVHSWGPRAESTETFDRDAGTLRSVSKLAGKKRSDRTTKLDPTQVADVLELANAAWDEETQGRMTMATDVREDLYILDGDEAFYVSGHPISANGRPAAAQAVLAVHRAAK